MFTIRTTLMLNDGETIANSKEVVTSQDAFDHYREACEVSKERMVKSEIKNYMVELIPSKKWKGVLDYRMKVGKE